MLQVDFSMWHTIRRVLPRRPQRYVAGVLLVTMIYIASLSLYHGEKPKPPPPPLPVTAEPPPPPLPTAWTCSVKQSFERAIEPARFDPPADVLAANATRSPRLPGLLFSVWSGEPGLFGWFGFDAARRQWKCQIKSHEAFAAAQGVHYRLVRDQAAWAEERSRDGLAPHWMKVQAIRHLLSEGHAWLFYVDTDTVFGLRKKGEFSLNSLMSTLDPATSIVMDGANSLGVGWNTDRVLLVNNGWTKYFMEQVWGLRLDCASLGTISEQASFVVVLLEAMIHDLKVRVDRKEREDAVLLKRHSLYGATDLSACCFVRELCLSPKMNVKLDTQGCTWAWQLSLGLNNAAFESKQMPYTTPRVTWEFRLSRLLGFGHPYKDQEGCRDVLDGKSAVKNDSVVLNTFND